MPSIRERHYDRVHKLVRRDSGDEGRDRLSSAFDRGSAANSFLDLVDAGQLARPAAPSLIPTADGDIAELLLTIPSYAVQHPTMAAAYQHIITSLPSQTAVVALVQNAVRGEVDAWLAAAGRQSTVETFDDTLNISVWAEDGYVVAKDGETGPTYFIEPYAFPRYADGLVADFVANFTDFEDTQAPLYFQGGNCLIGDSFFFIGADYPANTLKYVSDGILRPPGNEKPVEFVHGLYRSYLDTQRDLSYVGSRRPVPAQQTRKLAIGNETWTETICGGNKPGTVQPLFHIDMFITLVGREADGYRLLVGDPRLAYEILGNGPAPEHAMVAVFDDIAKSLSQQGFLVGRSPLPLVYLDDPVRKERFWYFATSNNALVQNGSTKEVWLPTYGYGAWEELKRTDDENLRIWSDLGFTVHQLPDFHPFAENLGAVHCIKKYLSRT